MKSFSNTYIFVFSLIMVTIVAVLLSSVAMQLKPRQQANIETEKKQDVLRSVGEAGEADDAEDKNEYIEEEFEKYFKDSYVVDYSGKKVETDAFEVLLAMDKEIRKEKEERNYPVFIYHDDQGGTKYVVPVRGKGLWGPIWGTIALEEDLNTISGAVFDHQGETPGLGAEINTDWFQEPFKGKQLFNEQGEFVSITVVKGGADEDSDHDVDGISGGTITSKALEAMMLDCIEGYVAHFDELKNN